MILVNRCSNSSYTLFTTMLPAKQYPTATLNTHKLSLPYCASLIGKAHYIAAFESENPQTLITRLSNYCPYLEVTLLLPGHFKPKINTSQIQRTDPISFQSYFLTSILNCPHSNVLISNHLISQPRMQHQISLPKQVQQPIISQTSLPQHITSNPK